MAPPSPPAAVPPALMEELIEEILLRFPADEPAGLFRASLVCKPWCRLISGARFRRRYREFHRTPPMLGFFCGRITGDGFPTARFVPKSALGFHTDRCCLVVDARHGRVLLLCHGEPATGRKELLLVWDPITDKQREIPLPKLRKRRCSFKAAVVCAAAGDAGACDHLDCHGGAFLVVLVISYSAETSIQTYSSDAGSWSDPIFSQHSELSTEHDQDGVDFFLPSVLAGNALYFGFWSMKRVLKYDLEFHEVSIVGLPGQPGVLTTTEDGQLGLATIRESKLYVWSRKHGPEAADDLWTRDRVIQLEKLLCSNAILTKPVLVDFVDRIGVILLRADDALFTVDLKTSQVKKVCDKARSIRTVVPYMSFCTPDFGGPSAGGSSV